MSGHRERQKAVSDAAAFVRTIRVTQEISDERKRQREKWGPQNHSDLAWNAIFGEEVGEVAKEVVEGWASEDFTSNLRTELIQSAAVAVAWVEAIDRRQYDSQTA